MIEYLGADYHVGCMKVHPSRIGDVLTAENGETDYLEVRRIRGVDPAQGFLLLGHERRCPWSLATAVDGDLSRVFAAIEAPQGVRLVLGDRAVGPGQVVRVRLVAPKAYSHGVAMTLHRTKRPKLVRSVEETGRPGWLRTQHLWTPPEVAEFVFRGTRAWRWRVPDLPPGPYELRKEVVLERPPQLGWGRPASEITTTLTILR